VSTMFIWGKKFLATAVLSAFAVTLASAQTPSIEEGKRKVKVKVNPIVPDFARRMNIIGKVKIEVVIASDGHVKTAHAIGGNPVLVQSCLDSVKDWKFDAAPEETTQIIEFEFK